MYVATKRGAGVKALLAGPLNKEFFLVAFLGRHQTGKYT